MPSIISFTQDGRLAASGDLSGEFTLWDIATSEITKLPSNSKLNWNSMSSDRVSAAFSPNERLLALSSAASGHTVGLWDIPLGKCIALEFPKPIAVVLFSPDNTRLALGSEDGTIWIQGTVHNSLTQLERMRSNGRVTCLSFLSSEQLVSSYNDGSLGLWNVVTRMRCKKWNFRSGLQPIAISAGSRGNFVVVLKKAYGSGAFLWDSSTTNYTPLDIRGEIRHPKISPNGKMLAFLSFYSHGKSDVVLWDLTTRDEIKSMNYLSRVLYFAFLSNDRFLVYLEGGIGNISDLSDISSMEKGSRDSEIDVDYVSISPCETFAVSKQRIGSKYMHTAKRWVISTGEVLEESPIGNPYNPSGDCFSPDGKLLVYLNHDEQTVAVWDNTAEPNRQFLYGWKFNPRHDIHSISFSADGGVLVATEFGPLGARYNSRVITIWKLTSEAADKIMTKRNWNDDFGKITTYVGDRHHFRKVVFSPDSNLLAFSHRDNTISIWDIGNHSRTKLGGHSKDIDYIKFSNNNKFLVSRSWISDEILLWNLGPRDSRATIQPFNLSPLGGECIYKFFKPLFSPDSSSLAVVFSDCAIGLLNINTRSCYQRFDGRANGIPTLSFAPDGKVLLSSYSDGTIKFWDIDTTDSPESQAAEDSGASTVPIQRGPKFWETERTLILPPGMSLTACCFRKNIIGMAIKGGGAVALLF
ncbi:hypothetical protein ABW19_dt0209835 [Dactylella cylindrospora]|nr:hypothetical protein ABW19_dt0209835 [Dactylella cylindrospora]